MKIALSPLRGVVPPEQVDDNNNNEKCVTVANSLLPAPLRILAVCSEISQYYAGWHFDKSIHGVTRSRHTMRVDIVVGLQIISAAHPNNKIVIDTRSCGCIHLS